MISLFFMPMLPLSLIAGALSLITAHFTEKYLLFRRHTAPQATGSKLCFAMFRFFDIVMLVFSVSFSVLRGVSNEGRSVRWCSTTCLGFPSVDTVGPSSV
jgi:hypothetical protein